MKTGTAVRLIQPVIQGLVKERRINPATDELELLVEWTDADGQAVQRWFDADKLEEVAA